MLSRKKFGWGDIGDRCGVWLLCGCGFVQFRLHLCVKNIQRTLRICRNGREIEADGDKLTDLDVRRLGPGDLATRMSVRTDHNREAEDYHRRRRPAKAFNGRMGMHKPKVHAPRATSA
jgi:hypothetical protein